MLYHWSCQGDRNNISVDEEINRIVKYALMIEQVLRGIAARDYPRINFWALQQTGLFRGKSQNQPPSVEFLRRESPLYSRVHIGSKEISLQGFRIVRSIFSNAEITIL